MFFVIEKAMLKEWNKNNEEHKVAIKTQWFKYLTDCGASNKTEYLNNLDRFVTKEITEKPILFEIFTESNDESEALKNIVLTG